MMAAVHKARLPVAILLMLIALGCNRSQPGVSCAPLRGATTVRISQSGGRQYVIENRYRVQALMNFANGRRAGFSARTTLPVGITSATFLEGTQPLLTFSAGDNFFSLACDGRQGVQEANRVQIAEFERLAAQQP